MKSISHRREPIYCCGCGETVDARLTNGGEIYSNRPDLRNIPIWKCDACGNYVGCHRKTKDPICPLGCIPTKSIRNARKRIHELLDPLWKSGKMNRSILYKELSDKIGWQYHTAKIKSLEEVHRVYRILQEIKEGLC